MKQLFVSLLCIMFYFTSGYSQTSMGISGIPSPNVTSLGMVNEVPVSLYTGKADITLPIYEFNDGDIKVPIYLTYNSSGAKPDVHPGWVGQNWALQAGGMITRTVKGLPDETKTTRKYELTGGLRTSWIKTNEVGYFYNQDKNKGQEWSGSNNIKSDASADDWKDTEPDVFTYNINGMSGTFYMGEDGVFHCRSNPDIRINVIVSTITFPDYAKVLSPDAADMYLEKNSNLTNRKIIGFEIVMNDGMTYTFGCEYATDKELTNEETLKLEYSVDFFSQTFLEQNFNTWMLTKITSPNNNCITFNYQRGKINAEDAVLHPIVSFRKSTTYQKTISNSKVSTLDRILFPFSGEMSASSLSLNSHFSGDIIFPVYLSSIESENKKLVFTISESTELKYDYSAILADLFTQISNYTPCYWGNTTRSLFKYSTSFLQPQIMKANGFDHYWLRTDLYNNDVSWLTNVYRTRTDLYSYYENFLGSGNTPYFSYYAIYQDLVLARPPIIEAIDLDRIKWFKLDAIKLYDKVSAKNTNEWVLEYNNNPDERLMLLSLKEKGANSAEINPYTFEYEDYNGTEKYDKSSNKLPGYNSTYLDHWGYYNGANSEITGFDNATLSAYYDKRNASEDYMYAAQLNKINYPTGGTVEFTYEPNNYSTLIKRNVETGAFEQETYTSPITGGGLRIKKIEYKDGGTVKSEKSYTYSKGILGQEIKYYWPNYVGTTYGYNKKEYSTYTSDRFISENLLPGCGGLDYTISYPKVEEKVTGAGITEFYYSNHITNPDENFIETIDNNKSISSPFSSKDFERGQLQRKIYKNENGKIIKKERYTYCKNNNITKEYIPAVSSWRFCVLEDTWSIEGASYKNYIYPYYLSERIDSLYDPEGNYLTRNVETYLKNSHNLLSEQTVTNTDEIIKTRYNYVFDYPQDFADENTPMGQMAVFNILTPITDEYKYKNGTLIGGTSYVYGNMGNKVYAPYEVYMQKGNLPEERRAVYYNYNANGQPLYFVKDNAEKIISIWGYNYQYPIIQVKGATISEFMSALKMSVTDDIDALSRQATPDVIAIRNSLVTYFANKNVQITTCIYDTKVGLKSITDPRGVITYFDYDDFGRLKEKYYFENGDASKKRVLENYEYNYFQKEDL